jgi:hypothetical protein
MFILNHKTSISLPRFSHKTDRRSKSKPKSLQFAEHVSATQLEPTCSLQAGEAGQHSLCSVDTARAMIMNGEYRTIWKEAAMVYFRV